MRSETLHKGIYTIALPFFLCVTLLLGMTGLTSADEDISVTCYRGTSRIGTVTVFDWRTAAEACNTLLYDCRGACMGCFRDFDYVEDICVDLRGNEFLR